MRYRTTASATSGAERSRGERVARLQISDIPAARKIDRLCFRADDQYAAAYYDEIIASSRFEALGVFDAAGTLQAWVLVDMKADPVRIRSLAVHPHCRRRGYASALVATVVRAHRGTIDLLVEPDNAPALALYEKLGFVVASPDAEMPQRVRMVRVPG